MVKILIIKKNRLDIKTKFVELFFNKYFNFFLLFLFISLICLYNIKQIRNNKDDDPIIPTLNNSVTIRL